MGGYAAAEQQQLADTNGQLESVQNELAAAEGNAAALDRAYAEQQRQAAQEQSKQDRINGIRIAGSDNAVALAQLDVDAVRERIEAVRAKMNAPYLYAQKSGIVLAVGYTAGMEAAPDKPVASIGDPDGIYAMLQVAQADIGDIEEGQIVEFSFDAYPERVFTGVVTKKLPMPVEGSNPVVYVVHASLDMEGEPLLAGMTCNAQFIIKQVKDVLRLSNKAIRMADGKQVVLMKDDGGALYEQPITTGFSDGRTSEVLEGLSDGDIVYVEG